MGNGFGQTVAVIATSRELPWILWLTQKFPPQAILFKPKTTFNVPCVFLSRQHSSKFRYVYDVDIELLHAGFPKTVETCPYPQGFAELFLPDIFKERYNVTFGGAQDPSTIFADYYLVPQYMACCYHQCLTSPREQMCVLDTVNYLEKIIDYIEDKYPFWARNGGRDHLFVNTLDDGPLMLNGTLWDRISQAIFLTHTGKFEEGKDFKPGKDICIPAYRDYRPVKITPEERYNPRPGSPAEHRPIMAYFRGGITSEKYYSNGTRLAIRKLGRTDPHFFYVREGHSTSYWNELQKSQFALCPAGWAPWSPRLFDAVIAGAIPVIIADKWKPPFEGEFLDYSEFSIRVPESKVWMLKEILKGYTKEQIGQLRSNMGKIYQFFVYSSKPFGNMDAIGAIHEILRRRLEESTQSNHINEEGEDDLDIMHEEAHKYEGFEISHMQPIKVYL